MDSLHKHIDPKYLPKVYGGVRPNYPYQHWFINLKKNAAVVKGRYLQHDNNSLSIDLKKLGNSIVYVL